jgi:tagatose-1,6-bisphosphate aldolase non-catalytic subunit AgaZ/GatZ
MKIPEQVPTTDENLTEVSDTEAIDPTPSISQPLFRSRSQSHYFKRQFSKSDQLQYCWKWH